MKYIKVRDLQNVVNFPIEIRIKSILDTYTVLRIRLNEYHLPTQYIDLLKNIQKYCDKHEELELISVSDGQPEIRLKNIDVKDLVVLEITPDWIVYVGWEKNI